MKEDEFLFWYLSDITYICIMRMSQDEILDRIRMILQAVAPEAKALLFGSRARGDAREDSDMDLLILVDTEFLSFKKKADIMDVLYDLELESGVLISPIIYTRKEWENRPFRTPFYVNVMNEGVSL